MSSALYCGHHEFKVVDNQPSSPGKGEVQLKVSHCGVCGTDLHIYHGKMDHRVKVPQSIGHEMSGTIEEIGEEVTGWAVGDRVTVRPLDPCLQCPACLAGNSHICMKLKFVGIDTPGALQSTWTVPAHTLHRIPESLSLKHAALIEPIAVACHDVRMSKLQAGEFAVIIGGGPIGALIGLCSLQAGAKVVVLEINPVRRNLAIDLGLDVVNPKEVDIEALVLERTNGAGADVVFEVSASPAGAELMTKLVKVRGRLVQVGIFSEPVKVDLFKVFWRELQIIGCRVYEREDFETAIQLAASGSLPLDKIISREIPLQNIKEAFETLDKSADVLKILLKCS